MRRIILFLALITLFTVASQALHTRWSQLDGYTFEKYVVEYNKRYSTKAEYNFRKSLFLEKLEQIKDFNKLTTQTYKKGINHLSDLTSDEFNQLLGHKKHSGRNIERTEIPAPSKPPPDQVDWRNEGIITAVKNQGQCGSCWAFSAVESVESFTVLVIGQLQDLSIQEVLDCTANPDQCGGQGGCAGATYELAWQAIQNLGGLASEWTYPYLSYFGQNYDQCRYNSTVTTPQTPQLTGYVALPVNQYEPVVTAVAETGPLSISVDASTWSDYETGVFNGCNQTTPDINHAVQLVGYGEEKGTEYWLVRNSWSPSWGEDGYIKLYKSAKVECGVDITPQDGSGCLNGPPNVTVCGTCGVLFEAAYPSLQGFAPL